MTAENDMMLGLENKLEGIWENTDTHTHTHTHTPMVQMRKRLNEMWVKFAKIVDDMDYIN